MDSYHSDCMHFEAGDGYGYDYDVGWCSGRT